MITDLPRFLEAQGSDDKALLTCRERGYHAQEIPELEPPCSAPLMHRCDDCGAEPEVVDGCARWPE